MQFAPPAVRSLSLALVMVSLLQVSLWQSQAEQLQASIFGDIHDWVFGSSSSSSVAPKPATKTKPAAPAAPASSAAPETVTPPTPTVIVPYVAPVPVYFTVQGYRFPRTIRTGMMGDDVLNLQFILNRNPLTQMAKTGLESPGEETGTYDYKTRIALIAFQKLNFLTDAQKVRLHREQGVAGLTTRQILEKLAKDLVAQGKLPSDTTNLHAAAQSAASSLRMLQSSASSRSYASVASTATQTSQTSTDTASSTVSQISSASMASSTAQSQISSTTSTASQASSVASVASSMSSSRSSVASSTAPSSIPAAPLPIGVTNPLALVIIPKHNIGQITSFAYAPQTDALKAVLSNADLAFAGGNTQAEKDFLRSAIPNGYFGSYSNYTNIYGDLYLDWLKFADDHGYSRDDAFYHVLQPWKSTLAGGSSKPVNKFWGYYLTTTATASNYQNIIYSGSANTPLSPSVDAAAYFGYPDPFREINATLASGASGGWKMNVEYASSIDGQGFPSGWKTLPLLSDTTNGLVQAGQMLFDPPADWKTGTIGGQYLYYLRFRTTTTGAAPQLKTLRTSDFSGANGTVIENVPVFDTAADSNGDGYLTDSEYANHSTGKDARFYYQSRLYSAYGPMRFVTNPSNAHTIAWGVDYFRRQYDLLKPTVNGPMFIFMDNTMGHWPLSGAVTKEGIGNYAQDVGTMGQQINANLPSGGYLMQHAGYTSEDFPVVQKVPFSWREKYLRPMNPTSGTLWTTYETMLTFEKQLAALTNPQPYVGINTLYFPGVSDPFSDFQVASVAMFLQVRRDPARSFLGTFNNYDDAADKRWAPIQNYDFGTALGDTTVFAQGTDPGNGANYKIYQRSLDGPAHDGQQHVLVLYKPLSFTDWTYIKTHPATIDASTETTHNLGGTYKILNADGTLSAPVTQVSLRNGHGVILVK